MKNKFYQLFLLILILSACNPSPKSSSTTSNTKVENRAFDLTDSLNKYSNADSVLIIGNGVPEILFISKANKMNYAIWINPDSVLVFYQKNANEKWKVMDTLDYKTDFSFVNRVDINGDG